MKAIYTHNNQPYPIRIERAGEDFTFEKEGATASLRLIAFAPPRLTFSYQGKIITARVATDGKKRWVHVAGATFVLERHDAATRHAHSHGAREGTGSGIVVAPMPGQVRAVLVQSGDPVTEGQPLLLLEAMKMELKVTAPHTGTVTKIHVTPGQSVERDQILGEVTESGD